MRNHPAVRDFFCLDDPPIFSDSIEENRAIFEAQEETIAFLKLQLKSKDDVIENLQSELRLQKQQNEYLMTLVKWVQWMWPSNKIQITFVDTFFQTAKFNKFIFKLELETLNARCNINSSLECLKVGTLYTHVYSCIWYWHLLEKYILSTLSRFSLYCYFTTVISEIWIFGAKLKYTSDVYSLIGR